MPAISSAWSVTRRGHEKNLFAEALAFAPVFPGRAGVTGRPAIEREFRPLWARNGACPRATTQITRLRTAKGAAPTMNPEWKRGMSEARQHFEALRARWPRAFPASDPELRPRASGWSTKHPSIALNTSGPVIS
jgi:hypothetical protein